MKVTDNIVKEEFKAKRYVYNPNTLRRYISRIEGKYNKDIYEYLINRYNDSDSLKETLFRIYNGIEEHPKCPTCGKPLVFKGIFFKFCSNICAQSSDEIKQKIRQTCLEKYGVDNYNKTKESKEKIKQTCLEKYGVEYFWQSSECKEKIKQTCLEKYGVDSPLKSEKIRNKGKQTCLEKYGVDNPAKLEENKEKVKQTCLKKYGTISTTQCKEIRDKIKQSCLEKYGVDNPAKLEENKEKVKQTCLKKYGGLAPICDPNIKNQIKQTCLEKYGVDNYGKSLKHKINMSTIMSSDEMQEHRYNVMTKNHSFNTSKPEEELYLYIKEKFPSVKRQYKDKLRYPYNCDFYIPELDYFIELQGYYTHNTHPYNPNSILDQVLVERYGTKCQAITIWILKDPEKRECAKRNNLNFKEIWNLEEGKKFIDNLFENQNIKVLYYNCKINITNVLQHTF